MENGVEVENVGFVPIRETVGIAFRAEPMQQLSAFTPEPGRVVLVNTRPVSRVGRRAGREEAEAVIVKGDVDRRGSITPRKV